MQKIISLIFKFFRKILRLVINQIEMICCNIQFYLHNVEHKDFSTNGLPFISVAIGGRCFIDEGFKMNNNLKGNPIGRPQPCIFFVDRAAILLIGKNVGISATAIVTHHSISIGDNVKIGGGVCIYDSDFHSLDPKARVNSELDRQSQNKLPVFIEDNVFIGAHSTVLKGVTIGKNSIVGACSVVVKNIPANEIWAGNPARFIRKLND